MTSRVLGERSACVGPVATQTVIWVKPSVVTVRPCPPDRPPERTQLGMTACASVALRCKPRLARARLVRCHELGRPRVSGVRGEA